MKKKETKTRLIKWVLLFQYFNLWIMDRKETENLIADHLSRIENNLKEETIEEIKETFKDEQLFRAKETHNTLVCRLCQLYSKRCLSTIGIMATEEDDSS
ncbi:protein NYNRIN-like [Gossypium australe]|uniref:Protein NYNRIN-like n=1 Tax=Gossypium australe TaxID=47621 RepID=A0A5B6WUV7_9ROSI|nr:protein NYNRIN-like [Gossypium australe]